MSEQARCFVLHLSGGLGVEAERAEESGLDDFARRERAVRVVWSGGLDEADRFAQLGQVGLAEFFADDRALAGAGEEMAGEDAGERALARPVGAQDRATGA